ncbi:MAG: glycosyl transferase family protein [Acidobacteriaceae bacterium]|nr:glycosyl transferase family protein [Acidobacteriaceae bacterium]
MVHFSAALVIAPDIGVAFWPFLLRALANLLLLSGIDDLAPLLICVVHWIRSALAFSKPPPAETPGRERRIAIFVPCWKESDVIANMVRHNLAAIRYRNYDFFLGAYPNDPATVRVVQNLRANYQNVHVAVCPHPGPTSKADCLNWIYCRMSELEEERGIEFDTVVLHDAEDLIHPEALHTINRERAVHAMVQVPVLPLPTPFREMTHGIYCDEFAEFQTIDMPARGYCGSFIPSNGVGTGFARHILQRLARERRKVFDPSSLTEDYEIGVYIHQSGFSQVFVPLRCDTPDIMATREYFPRKVKLAIRQRTRWVTGNALQSWERYGWRGPLSTKYWFWRDRKGLVANPLSFLTNLLFLTGLLTFLWSLLAHRHWAFAVPQGEIVRLCWMTSILQYFRIALRMVCVARIYGIVFALGVPLRCLHGNFINSLASCSAIGRFTKSKLLRQPLVWLKTEHAYPAHAALPAHGRDFSDVLVSSGILSTEGLLALNAHVTSANELADLLLNQKIVSDGELCRALSLQSGLAATRVELGEVKQRILQSLPTHVQEHFGIIPYRVEAGKLMVAGTRVPSPDVFEKLKAFTLLPVEFQLVTKGNFEELQELRRTF